jgi:hypothetical protein
MTEEMSSSQRRQKGLVLLFCVKRSISPPEAADSISNRDWIVYKQGATSFGQ